MTGARIQVAAIAAASVFAALLLILLIYNVGASAQIEQRATRAIDATIGETLWETPSPAPYYADELVVFEDGEELELVGYSRKEIQLIDWCKTHEVSGIQKASIGSATYYLAVQRMDDGFSESAEDIVYVEVTGELAMIRRFNWYFVIAAACAGVFAMLAGYRLGKRLEQKELAERRFFENASHELKTPLAAIRGYAEGIMTGVITDYAKAGRVICAQAEKMGDQLNAILQMARIESGTISLEREQVDLADFLEDCLMPFEGAISARGLEVSLDLERVVLPADPSRLESAVSNLLTNAIKYAKSRIAISLDGRKISIWNDAEALSDEDISHMFDRFHAGPQGDTGVGLALAKGIVGLHGWKLLAARADGGISLTIVF